MAGHDVFLKGLTSGERMPSVRLGVRKNLTILMWFLYVSEKTDHLSRLSDFQTQNEKPSTNG